MAAAPEASASAATPPLQGGDPLLQHVLGGVGQPPVDVSGIRQTKPGGGVGGIPKHIAGGLVDRNRPGIGGGVGLLLAHMELQCLKPESVKLSCFL